MDLGSKIPAATALAVEVEVAVALAEEALDLVILGDKADEEEVEEEEEGGAAGAGRTEDEIEAPVTST